MTTFDTDSPFRQTSLGLTFTANFFGLLVVVFAWFSAGPEKPPDSAYLALRGIAAVAFLFAFFSLVLIIIGWANGDF